MSIRLVDHLPRVLTDDPALCDLLGIFQELEDEVQELADSAAELVDPEMAPLPMVRFLARWMGIFVDPSLEPDGQRNIAQHLSDGVGWTGTRQGAEQMLGLLTGCTATVRDTGGIYATGQAPARADKLVWIDLDGTGPSTHEGLATLVGRVVPADVAVRVQLPDAVVFVGAPWPADVGGMPA